VSACTHVVWIQTAETEVLGVLEPIRVYFLFECLLEILTASVVLVYANN
jgi:hypothetical protein